MDVAESLSLWLQDWGHDVRVAHTGEQALAEARAFRPELLLIDVGLPGMNGHEAARKLRELPEIADAMLVAVRATARRTTAVCHGRRDSIATSSSPSRRRI